MTIVFLEVSFFWLYLVNEFFGKLSAVLLTLAGSLSLAALGAVLLKFPRFPENFPVDFDQTALISVISALFVGGLFISVLYEFFRKITHSRLAFLRIILASFFGFAFATAAEIVFSWKLADFVTSYGQLFLLMFFSLPFFYTARFLLAPLVGKAHYEWMKAQFARKPLFKPAEKDFFEARQSIQEQRI